jgi:hypothetical protein
MTVWTSKPAHGRHVCDLETPAVDEIASNALLKIRHLFPEKKTGFMIAI